MPKTLSLSYEQRERIFHLYARGLKPAEISRGYPELGNLSAKQIENLILRSGWSRRKEEISKVQEQAVEQILLEARKQASKALAPLLQSHAESLENR
jgi:hypothetical protein